MMTEPRKLPTAAFTTSLAPKPRGRPDSVEPLDRAGPAIACRATSPTMHRVSLSGHPDIQQLIDLAKREDLGTGDLSSALLPNRDAPGSFRLVAKETCTIAGQEIAQAVLAAYDPALSLSWCNGISDGHGVTAVPADLGIIEGPLASVLAAERVVLNFLQRLCGIATLTRKFVEAVAGTGAEIFDTRKTTPGWRILEKYAVRCGGGRNHRMGLFDAVLIKDNHLAGVATDRLAGHVFGMLNSLDLAAAKRGFVTVEAQSVAHAAELLKVVGLDVIILDNFGVQDLRRAVGIRDGLGLRGKVDLEASGGVRLQNVAAVAETGVERISVGAITHSAVAVDLSLERE